MINNHTIEVIEWKSGILPYMVSVFRLEQILVRRGVFYFSGSPGQVAGHKVSETFSGVVKLIIESSALPQEVSGAINKGENEHSIIKNTGTEKRTE